MVLLYKGASKKTLLGGLMGLHQYFEITQRVNQSYGTRCPTIVEFLGNPQNLNIIFTSRQFQMAGEYFDQTYKFVGPSLSERSDSPGFPFDQLRSDPLIYISMGTVFNDLPEFYRACFEALADEPYQIVLAVGQYIDLQDLGKPPGNFIIQPFVPQLEILEQAALFITHGGMNSVNEGLLYQVPLIVVPQRGDQYIVARRVAELGVGLSLMTAEATPNV